METHKIQRGDTLIKIAAQLGVKVNDLLAANPRLKADPDRIKAGDVIRICTKADVVHKYCATDWDNLDPLIQDIVVDLRYRGDYTPATRTRAQPIVVANNPTKLKNLMGD